MELRKTVKSVTFLRFLACLLTAALFAGNCPIVPAQAETMQEQEEKSESQESALFKHPGLLHTEESFEKMKGNIQNQVQPNLETWDLLNSDGFSDAGWNPRPAETVVRGGDGDNRAGFYIDIRRAYQNALIWKISGSEEHGEAACRILNAWSGTMKSLTGNADRFLASGIYGYTLSNAAELMRDHPGFQYEPMKELLLNVFYPMNDDFLKNHNGAHIGNYWANWDLCNIAAMMSIGIFCDREDIYRQALNYYKTGTGNGSIYNAMPYVYEGNLAQWQESGRDQGHTTFGISLCEVICETAWNQGDDLYGLSDNRLLKAAEYVARYNYLEEELPYSAYEWLKGQSGQSEWQSVLSNVSRGIRRLIYSMVYNHYVNRKGLKAPGLEQALKSSDGNHVIEGAQANGDELGWQTLTYANLSGRVEDRRIQGDFADGVYRMRSVLTGKSLVDQDGILASAQKGSKLEEWWEFRNKGDGEYIVTNVSTGRTLQVCSDDNEENDSEYYSYGTIIGTGQADGSLAQNFAFVKNHDTGDYRIISTINYCVLSLKDNKTEDSASIIQDRNRSGVGQKWIIEKASELGAEFHFDDETSGFSSDNALAKGNYSLAAHGSGKALSLNGTSHFLTVESKTGGSILDSAEEFTVSFEAKPESGASNWMFYAAPAGNSGADGTESCLGILENNGTITVERQKNGSSDSSIIRAQAATEEWYHVAVVFAREETILYINGQEKARQALQHSVSDILGAGSLLQIGKADRGTGAYYQGLMDNFKMTGHAMNSSEVMAEAADYVKTELPEILAEFNFDDEKTGFAGEAAEAKGSYSLKEHNSGKALYLNGQKDCLRITGKDGSTLVPGGLVKEMTVFLQAKKEGGNGWVFYAAPNDYAQNYLYEKYLGILDNDGKVLAERYANQGERLPTASGASQAGQWHYIAAVFTETEIILYDNGEETARTANDVPLQDILGSSSVFYIGKANWGNGEYFQGMIDNYKVVSRAWSKEEIKAEMEKCEGQAGIVFTELDAKIAEASAIEAGKYTEETFRALQTAIESARTVRNTAASQKEVDQAVENLQKAVYALREKGSEDLLVERVELAPSDKSLTVGEQLTLQVKISPENAKNQELDWSSTNPAVARASGKTVTAVGPGEAVITAKAKDGSKAQASVKVKVTLNPVKMKKAVQQSNKKYVTISYGKVTGAAGYDIYRSTKAAGGYQFIGSSSKTTYVDKKAAAGKTYYYKAVAKAKTENCNSTISGTYAKVKVLAVPKVKVRSQRGGRLTVSWKKVSGASGYVVYTSNKKSKGFKAAKTVKKAKTVKAAVQAKKNVKKLYVKIRPYYSEKGRKVFGTYSKSVSITVMK